MIAQGIINAAKNIGMKKPIIIRLKGTNVKEAKKLIEVNSFTTFIIATTMIAKNYQQIYYYDNICFISS